MKLPFEVKVRFRVRRHGTQADYRSGCRCDRCRSQETLRREKRRKRSNAIFDHGTTTGYRNGCRCVDCAKAQADYRKAYAARK